MEDNKVNTAVTISKDSLSNLLYRLLALESDKMESLQKDASYVEEDQVLNAFNNLKETRAHINAMYNYKENDTKIAVINPS